MINDFFMRVVGYWAVLFSAVYSISYGILNEVDFMILGGCFMLLAFSILLNLEIEND